MPTFNDYLNESLLFQRTTKTTRDIRIDNTCPTGGIGVTHRPAYETEALEITLIETGQTVTIVLEAGDTVSDWISRISVALAEANRPNDDDVICHIIENLRYENDIAHSLSKATAKSDRIRDDLRAHPLYNPDLHIVRPIADIYQNFPGVVHTVRTARHNGMVLAILTNDAWRDIKRRSNERYGKVASV